MLAFQNTPEAVLELPGIVATSEPVAINTAKFDLFLNLSERRAPDGTPEGIEGLIEYRTDLFERSSVEAIGRRLVALLEAVVADPISRSAALSSWARGTPANSDRLERHGLRGPTYHVAWPVRGPGGAQS